MKQLRFTPMKTSFFLPALLFTFCSIYLHLNTNACSMYKITKDGKTMVGCNEDNWRTTSRIWFASKNESRIYGAAFTGSRVVRKDVLAPQSGMNEAGLVFSRLASYHPNGYVKQEGKKQIKDEVSYLSSILHNFSTVKEVKEYISQHDHSIFFDDVFIYVDQSGDYLVVEPYELLEGNDSTYVLSNFCPSITTNEKARQLERYKNGKDFLGLHSLDTTLSFCKAVSDTMHVCRKRNGDGTLLTSIWDTKNGLLNLYFYHNYDTSIQFVLSEELAKEDHMLDITSLFPENPEFKRLAEYKTPFNVAELRISLVLIAGFLLLLTFLFLWTYFKSRNAIKFNSIKVVFAILNLLLVYYLFVLATNIGIYYFDAPYHHHNSDLISLSSYLPFLLLLIILPLSAYNFLYIRLNTESTWIKSALFLNNTLYFILMGAFGYWGLYSIFH